MQVGSLAPRGHCRFDAYIRTLFRNLLLEHDHGFLYHEAPVLDLIEAAVELLPGLVLQHLLVDVEHLDAGVLGLRLERDRVGPVRSAGVVFPLDPVLQVALLLMRQELLQLVLVLAPVLVELRLLLAHVPRNVVVLHMSERMPLQPVSLFLASQAAGTFSHAVCPDGLEVRQVHFTASL